MHPTEIIVDRATLECAVLPTLNQMVLKEYPEDIRARGTHIQDELKLLLRQLTDLSAAYQAPPTTPGFPS